MPILTLLASLFALFVVDFTFNVPVSLQDYVQPGSVVGATQYIRCNVLAGTSQIGTGSGAIMIPASGNFNGTVAVQVTVNAGHHASEVTDYKCWFDIGGFPATQALRQGDIRPRAGAAPVLEVSGHMTH